MSASQPANMRGRRAKTPLMLLLLLLTALTGTEELLVAPNATLAPVASSTLASVPDDDNIDSDHGSGLSRNFPGNSAISGTTCDHCTDVLETTEDPTIKDPSTTTLNETEPLDLIIILIPAVLVVVIIAMIVCGIVVSRRWSNKTRNEELRKEDPYLVDSCTEKVPMPMFEEDVPSVLELEMEELDQWMKKDGETPED